jgi:hypothetical protein
MSFPLKFSPPALVRDRCDGGIQSSYITGANLSVDGGMNA